uniref:Uncharacterized protein n=1 Tax=Kalanchoe fedtschenkoi TaxID=63787 RepID=A0A7N0VBU5_KALFE
MRLLLLVLLLSMLLLLCVSVSKEEEAAAAPTSSQITVMGVVYCDTCCNNSFSGHSYFLPGALVKIDCVFKALSPSTAEQISLSVKRFTDKYGCYKLEVPSVDGIECAHESAVKSTCQATLIASSSAACNVPGYTTTTDEIAVKSEQTNVCIYSLSALNYRPPKRDVAMCGEEHDG